MSTSICVLTFGDPLASQRDGIAASLLRQISFHPGATVLGDSYGHGEWFGDAEFCGSIVVSNLAERHCIFIAASAAARFGQDAVGVVYNAGGRTLATPGSTVLQSADEVWPS